MRKAKIGTATKRKLGYIGTAKIIDNGLRAGSEPEQAVCYDMAAAKATPRFDTRVNIAVVSHRVRLIDHDNLCAKWFIDTLREAGVIQDDSPRYVEEVSYRQVKVKTKSEEKTELIIEACKQ